MLVTYLDALVSVAETQLSAGHHGLFSGPRLSTDQAPGMCPISVWAQHLHTALIAGSAPRESDLCWAEGLGTMEHGYAGKA